MTDPILPNEIRTKKLTATARREAPVEEQQVAWPNGRDEVVATAQARSTAAPPNGAAAVAPQPQAERKASRTVVSPFEPKTAASNNNPVTLTAESSSVPLSALVAPSGQELQVARLSGSRWRQYGRVTLGVGLALSGVGFTTAVLPTPVFGQTSQSASVPAAPVTTPTYPARNTRAQHFDTVQDAISGFKAKNALSIVGKSTLPPDQVKHLEQVLQNHPNTYMMVVDKTADLNADKDRIGLGMGNSLEFQSVVNPETGKHDGAMFILFLSSEGNWPAAENANHPKIALHSSALLDDLGVGSENFAGKQGERRELADIWYKARHTNGEDYAGAMDATATRIDQVVDQYVQQTVTPVQQHVAQAQSALNGLKTTLPQFQKEFGKGGAIGSPDVDGWNKLMTQAQTAFNKHDLNGADNLSSQVFQQVRTQEDAMANYQQAPGIAADIGNQLKQTAVAMKSLGSNPDGQRAQASYAAAQQALEQYGTAYKAKNPNFMAPLQQARDAAKEAEAAAQASKAASQQSMLHMMYGGAAVVAALLALKVIAARASKKADFQINEKIAEIGQKSTELLALLNKADYHEVAGYEGETKAKADELLERVTSALTLVGGAQKFIDEAKKLNHPQGVKKLLSWFYWGGSKQAVDLLTNPNRKLPFSYADSARIAMEKDDRAKSWREQLEKNAGNQQFEKSLHEVMLNIADNHDKAAALVTEIDDKKSHITEKLSTVKRSAQQVNSDSQALQQSAQPENLFAAPSVTSNLMPAVLDDKEGLIAKGEAIKTNNFIRAWDEFAVPAERMAKEGGDIVGIGNEAHAAQDDKHGGDGILVTLHKADEALRSHDVRTEWAHTKTRTLSDRLDQEANTAMRTSVAKDLVVLRGDITEHSNRMGTAVAQDQQRREVSPGLISGAEQDVDTARKEIADTLHGMTAVKDGKQVHLFNGGTPEQVLREPNQDPTQQTQQAHADLDSVKPALDTGDVDTAGQHLNNVRTLSSAAHGIVSDTRQALADYPGTLQERQNRTDAIDKSIETTYQPAMDRMAQTYAPEVAELVAPEVGADKTVADNIKNADALLKTAREQWQDAMQSMDQAHILGSREHLGKSDQTLKNSQSQLDGVTKAEQLLSQHQAEVEKNLEGTGKSFKDTSDNAKNVWVRDHALELLGQANGALTEAANAVHRVPKNPYAAREFLNNAENLRGQVDSAIAADQGAYDSAVAALEQANTDLGVATGAIVEAGKQGWEYNSEFGNVREGVNAGDLAPASATLAQAGLQLGEANGLMRSKDWESAASAAQAASNTAGTAAGEATGAIDSAKSRFDDACAPIIQQEEEKAAAEKRAAEEAAAAQQRADEEAAAARQQQADDAAAAQSNNDTTVTDSPAQSSDTSATDA